MFWLKPWQRKLPSLHLLHTGRTQEPRGQREFRARTLCLTHWGGGVAPVCRLFVELGTGVTGVVVGGYKLFFIVKVGPAMKSLGTTGLN